MLEIKTFQDNLEMVLGAPLDDLQSKALRTYFDKCQTISMSDALRAVDPAWAARREPWEVAMTDGLFNPVMATWLVANGHVVDVDSTEEARDGEVQQ